MKIDPYRQLLTFAREAALAAALTTVWVPRKEVIIIIIIIIILGLNAR